MLFNYYLKYGHPQYKTRNLKKRVVVKVYAPIPNEHFTNVKFKGICGAACTEDDFTLADMPCMNLNDWISLFMILSKDEAKCEPIVSHLKRMLVC